MPRVVIVGAGFGGIAVAHALRSAPVETVLVDRHNFHTFNPFLYQVATALLEPAEVAQPTRSLLRKIPNADFRMARVTHLATGERTVHTDHGAIAYDYLVLAAGSVNNYFGHPRIAECALGLNDLGEALLLRNRILAACEKAVWTDDPEERRRLLTFVVVGGGPTGVEFAGSLAELVYGVLERDFRDLDLDQARLVLVEGSDLPLPPFAPKLQEAAARGLRRRGVEIVAGHVSEVADGTVRLGDGRELEAGTVVWAAGVRAEPLVEELGLELGSQRRVPVTPTLQLPDHPEVLAVGDLAEIQSNGRPLPMLAQVAIQSGAHAGRTIEALLAGRQPKPFRYRNLGTMATIGRYDAVAQLGALRLRGLIGWLAWVFVHILRTVGIRARLSVMLNWVTAYVLLDRPVRLLVDLGRAEAEETVTPPTA
jgi:NADH dehydrogenase